MKDTIKEHLAGLTQYMENQGCKINPYPNVVLRDDSTEAGDFFGKTGYYDPAAKEIVLFISGRHPKDIVRSYAHELIHHDQNLSGKMNSEGAQGGSDPKYAQNNPHLRKMEEDAYLRGNMMFRDYCDSIKYGAK